MAVGAHGLDLLSREPPAVGEFVVVALFAEAALTLDALDVDVVAAQPFLDDRPSYFEILTAAALEHFADVAVDVAVVEVGLGGRLDATNMIDAPAVSVITTIDYDHQQYLGDTLKPRLSVGFGVNWNSPFGPFRIDIAPVNRRMDEILPSPIHAFYQNQAQINGGKNNMFVAMSDRGAWTMGHFTVTPGVRFENSSATSGTSALKTALTASATSSASTSALGFLPDRVAAAMAVLDRERGRATPVAESSGPPARVVLFTGHMVDRVH